MVGEMGGALWVPPFFWLVAARADRTPILIGHQQSSLLLLGSALMAPRCLFSLSRMNAERGRRRSPPPCSPGSGVITDLGNNLQFGDMSCVFTTTADPEFGTFGLYGSLRVPTLPIASTNAARDAGDDSMRVGDDGRGVVRGLAVSGPCDLGAFEYDGPLAATVTNLNDSGAGSPLLCLAAASLILQPWGIELARCSPEDTLMNGTAGTWMWMWGAGVGAGTMWLLDPARVLAGQAGSSASHNCPRGVGDQQRRQLSTERHGRAHRLDDASRS
jgi:hypothetical protein